MKFTIKFIANRLSGLIAFPAVVGFAVGRCCLGRDKAFQSWSQTMSLLPGLTGVYLRRAFYRQCLASCANDVHIGFGSTFSQPEAKLGRGVYVGTFCSLGLTTIGDDALISSHVSILSGGRQHGTTLANEPIRRQAGVLQRVIVGEGAWIGERAVVMADIGRHCVIGAGSVVTRPIPDYSLAVGSPARVIESRETQWSEDSCHSA